MDFVGLMATELNLIGKLIYNVLYKWVDGWAADINILGTFSITVIMFTIFLKAITSPFDVWQKQLTRKNAKKMEQMKPELEKIQKQCGNNKELLMQRQRALYKEHKYSTFGGCIPMIITLVIFIVVFQGFNSSVRYHNAVTYEHLDAVYTEAYGDNAALLADGIIVEVDGQYLPAEGYTDADIRKTKTKNAEKAVLDAYEPQHFLLTQNIFMPDTWASPVPDAAKFSNTGIGQLGITGIDGDRYNTVMKPIMEKYNYTESGKKQWNGFLILPILVVVLNILSAKLNKPPEQPQVIGQTEEQKKAQQTQTKMLTYMMPLMMAVFAFLYSSAFTLYMLCNSLITTIFNLTYNAIAKKKDEKEKDRIMSTTLKR